MSAESHERDINLLLEQRDKLVDSINIMLQSSNDKVAHYCSTIIGKDKIINLIDKLNKLQPLHLKLINSEKLDNISSILFNFKKLFDPKAYMNSNISATASSDFDEYSSKLEKELEILTMISYLIIASFKYDDFNNKMKSFDNAVKRSEDMINAGEVLIKRIESEYTKLGVGIHGEAFRKEAEENDKISKKFLTATIIVSIAIAAFSAWLLCEVINAPYMDVSNAISWQGMIYRLIIFSTLSYILVFCSKNYTNMKHNATLNRHRQNALSTFTAFTETQQNPDVRDKITLLAAYCIFGHQSTGFLKNNKDDDSVINIWSIIESVITRKQSNS